MIGGRVTIDLHGTPTEGIVISSPTDDDESWLTPHVDRDSWIVRVDDMGAAYEVNDRRALKELSQSEVRQVLHSRRQTRR